MAIDLLDQLALEANFTYTSTSYGSPDECVAIFDGSCPKSWDELWGKALPEFDLIGSWWGINPRRHRDAEFLPAYVRDGIVLLVVSRDSAGRETNLLRSEFWAQIDWGAWAAPFSGGTWLLLSVALVATGLVMSVYQSASHVQGTPTAVMEDANLGQWYRNQSAVTHFSDSIGVQITGVSFVFVVMVVLASYTANAAALLTTEGEAIHPKISSVDDLLQGGYSACVSEDVYAKAAARWPSLGLVRVANAGDLQQLQMVRQGRCKASIHTESRATKLLAEGHCDVTMVGGALGGRRAEPYREGGSFAMRRDEEGSNSTRARCIKLALTVAMSTLLETSYLEELESFYFDRASRCSKKDEPMAEHSGRKALEPDSFLGLVALHTCLMLGLGPLAMAYQRLSRRRNEKRHRLSSAIARGPTEHPVSIPDLGGVLDEQLPTPTATRQRAIGILLPLTPPEIKARAANFEAIMEEKERERVFAVRAKEREYEAIMEAKEREHTRAIKARERDYAMATKRKDARAAAAAEAIREQERVIAIEKNARLDEERATALEVRLDGERAAIEAKQNQRRAAASEEAARQRQDQAETKQIVRRDHQRSSKKSAAQTKRQPGDSTAALHTPAPATPLADTYWSPRTPVSSGHRGAEPAMAQNRQRQAQEGGIRYQQAAFVDPPLSADAPIPSHLLAQAVGAAISEQEEVQERRIDMTAQATARPREGGHFDELGLWVGGGRPPPAATGWEL
jgi:hypothetical protein